MPPEYAITRGVVRRKNPLPFGDTENMVWEPRLVWHTNLDLSHTNPDFYAIWTDFIGDEGGLQNIDQKVICLLHEQQALWCAGP